MQPARPGAPFETRVALPDADGNDRGGVRLPAVAAPLGTYLGWNLHRGAARLGRWQGSFIPFSADEIVTRYGSEDAFMTRTAAAATQLMGRGLLLEADIAPILDRARRAWRATTGDSGGACR